MKLGKRRLHTRKIFAVFVQLGALSGDHGGRGLGNEAFVGKLALGAADLVFKAIHLGAKACALLFGVHKVGHRQQDGGGIRDDLHGILGADVKGIRGVSHRQLGSGGEALEEGLGCGGKAAFRISDRA